MKERTTCICMTLLLELYCGSNLFNAHHITFDISFPSKSVQVWVWKVLLHNSACILHVWVSMYTRVPPFLISLDVTQHFKPSKLDEALHISQIACYKKKFDCFYLIPIWTVTDWGVLTVFTGSDMRLYVAWTNFIVGITFIRGTHYKLIFLAKVLSLNIPETFLCFFHYCIQTPWLVQMAGSIK